MNPRPEDRKGDRPEELDLFSPESIEESLSEALNDLEKILEDKNAPTPTTMDISVPPDTAGCEDDHQDSSDHHAIPLLNDVVIPGISMTQRESTDQKSDANSHVPEHLDHATIMAQLTGPTVHSDQNESFANDMDEASLRSRLADRLASEVEVMVQARLEDALMAVCADIRRQVRNHMDIVLPEIVDNMLQHRHDHNN